MDNSEILQELFDSKILAILKTFFKDPDLQFYLLEVSKKSGVSSATTFRIVNNLVKLDLIRQIKINKFKLYQLNSNENIDFLQGFIREDIQVLKLFVNQIKDIPEIQAVILHGKETSTRANLLIIGENIDPVVIRSICVGIKDKYDFTVSYLTLAKEQYEQMSDMGLYSGQKKVLLQK